MEEFVQVCRALWDSVEPGAIVRDRATGRFADPSKVHRVDHDGPYFRVAGPLPSVPSPQGHPVLVQAGASPRGIAASASFADVVFGLGGHLPSQVAHRAKLDAALTEAGRDPADVGILWAIQVLVAQTESEAKARKDQMVEMLPLDAVGAYLSYNSGFDFSTLPSSFALAEVAESIVAAQATQAGFVQRLIAQRGQDATMTREEFFDEGWRWATGYEQTIAGTAEQVADELERQFEATGERGGFMICNPLSMPGSLNDVIALLMPELRRRGLVSEGYAGTTLRENLLAP